MITVADHQHISGTVDRDIPRFRNPTRRTCNDRETRTTRNILTENPVIASIRDEDSPTRNRNASPRVGLEWRRIFSSYSTTDTGNDSGRLIDHPDQIVPLIGNIQIAGTVQRDIAWVDYRLTRRASIAYHIDPGRIVPSNHITDLTRPNDNRS
jgi:hypothetical protein